MYLHSDKETQQRHITSGCPPSLPRALGVPLPVLRLLNAVPRLLQLQSCQRTGCQMMPNHAEWKHVANHCTRLHYFALLVHFTITLEPPSHPRVPLSCQRHTFKHFLSPRSLGSADHGRRWHLSASSLLHPGKKMRRNDEEMNFPRESKRTMTTQYHKQHAKTSWAAWDKIIMISEIRGWHAKRVIQ